MSITGHGRPRNAQTLANREYVNRSTLVLHCDHCGSDYARISQRQAETQKETTRRLVAQAIRKHLAENEPCAIAAETTTLTRVTEDR